MDIEQIPPYRVMLDIETLSTRADAVILSIGAVWITPTLEILTDWEFYCVIERTRSQRERHIDVNTVEWWLTKNNYPTVGTNPLYLNETLYIFNNWFYERCLVNPCDVEVWAKGTDFDISILRNAYEYFGIETPWAYNMVRDLRTFLKTTSIPYPPKEENPLMHNALGDARFQALQLISVLKAMRDGNQTSSLST